MVSRPPGNQDQQTLSNLIHNVAEVATSNQLAKMPPSPLVFFHRAPGSLWCIASIVELIELATFDG